MLGEDQIDALKTRVQFLEDSLASERAAVARLEAALAENDNEKAGEASKAAEAEVIALRAQLAQTEKKLNEKIEQLQV